VEKIGRGAGSASARTDTFPLWGVEEFSALFSYVLTYFLLIPFDILYLKRSLHTGTLHRVRPLAHPIRSPIRVRVARLDG
jgi:hypothetical protein